MQASMQCPQCGELVDAGAAYCGNCGASLVATVGLPMMAASQISGPTPVAISVVPQQPPLTSTPLPAYAVTSPTQPKVEGKAMIALILSILAVPGSIVPFVGWILAVISIVITTSIRSRLPHKIMSNLAIGFATLAIVVSAGVFAYNLNEYDKEAERKTGTTSTKLVPSGDQGTTGLSDKGLDTPCYALDAPGLVNVDTAPDSCQAQAYSGVTLNVSTNALNIEAVFQSKISADNLGVAGKEIADNYLRTSIPDFTVTSQNLGTFADSPAYIIEGKSGSNATIVLALVLHATSHGENIFVLAHAINDAKADLSQFESSWVWK